MLNPQLAGQMQPTELCHPAPGDLYDLGNFDGRGAVTINTFTPHPPCQIPKPYMARSGLGQAPFPVKLDQGHTAPLPNSAQMDWVGSAVLAPHAGSSSQAGQTPLIHPRIKRLNTTKIYHQACNSPNHSSSPFPPVSHSLKSVSYPLIPSILCGALVMHLVVQPLSFCLLGSSFTPKKFQGSPLSSSAS